MTTNAVPPAASFSINTSQRLILIVDDLPENLQVLAGNLKGEGYEILAANNGPRALALVRNRKPDIILLDIMMPDMDGFTVCQKLKEDPETADIPVIFITARTDTKDLLQGFEMGAVDYVTKPFKTPELLARVRTHLELKHSRDLFATYNRQLEKISAHLQKLNEDKNRFLSIVSHDIRGAFGNVIWVSRLLAEDRAIDSNDASELFSDIGIEAEHMIALAENLLNIDAIERREVKLKKGPVKSAPVVEFAVQAHQLAASTKNLKLEVACDNSEIFGDITACRQVLTNLVSNAVKFSPDEGTVRVEVQADGDGMVQISVQDDGPGLSAEDQTKLFQPFTRLSNNAGSHTHSVGLGLSIVKLMAEGMGGKVGCESVRGLGATFFALLPRHLG
ncbi:response regulator [soil metagenome]